MNFTSIVVNFNIEDPFCNPYGENQCGPICPILKKVTANFWSIIIKCSRVKIDVVLHFVEKLNEYLMSVKFGAEIRIKATRVTT